MTEGIAALGLMKSFGGVHAVSNVSLSCAKGEIHAVIGPNGAGKSTLVNLLSGELSLTHGQVFLSGKDLTGSSAADMSLRGIGRTYQKNNSYPNLTVLENCNLASQRRFGVATKMFRSAQRFTQIDRVSQEVIERVDLGHVIDRHVGELSHGEQRLVEIAIALALAPKVLLLDEPLAGMGAEESSKVVDLINNIKTDYATVLIEHDMDAVFALADSLTVMVNGEVIESGLPDAVRNSKAVQLAYLGEGGGND